MYIRFDCLFGSDGLRPARDGTSRVLDAIGILAVAPFILFVALVLLTLGLANTVVDWVFGYRYHH